MKLPVTGAHSCSLLYHLNSFSEECSSLRQKKKLTQIRCSIQAVILNSIATQYTCSLKGIYCFCWLVQWSHHCSCMHIPVHSFWLPGYIDVMQTVLYINNVWTSLDRPRTCTWMNVQHYWSVGKHKLKSQWDTTTHLLEWLKCKRLIIPCIGEDLEALLMGIQYRIDLETSFSVS